MKNITNIFLLSLLLVAGFLLWSLPQETSPSPPTLYKAEGYPYIVDGDSLKLNSHEIRLKGLDAPELHQKCRAKNKEEVACGQEAKQHLKNLIKDKKVTCYFDNVDKYNRALAKCRAGDIDLNSTMVIDGYAVNYYDYRAEEILAKQEKRGIWQYSFTRPQKWRRSHQRPFK